MKLGQNFLKSKAIINEIVKAAEIKKSDTVLEIGPGKGILTEALIKNAGVVIAVEKDYDLVEHLREKFKEVKNLKLVHGDILKFEKLSGFARSRKAKEIGNYKIVANIPYYITSHFLRKFLQTQHQPSMMVLMLQKEVAERITAKNGKESILSISVKAYGQPKIIKNVPAKYFSPKPKVDSVIIKIEKISKEFFKEIDPTSPPLRQGFAGRARLRRASEKEFFELVKKGFSSKRKMLKNNLGISGEILKKCGINEKIRAEKLSLEDWKCLYKIIRIRKYQSLDPKWPVHWDKPCSSNQTAHCTLSHQARNPA